MFRKLSKLQGGRDKLMTRSVLKRRVLQCKAGGVDMQALLSGVQPEQYVTMLTAANAKEVVALMDVGQDPGLLDAKAIMAATVETLLQAENRLHSTVTATAAAATVHVRHCLCDCADEGHSLDGMRCCVRIEGSVPYSRLHSSSKLEV